MSYIFYLFILFFGFSRQEYWGGLSFPSPVDHILSELSTMTHPSWVVLHGMAHSFNEFAKLWAMWSVWLVFCDYGFHSVCPLPDKSKRLIETSWWERVTGGTESCSDGWGHAQFSSVQFRCSVMSHTLWLHGLHHSRPPCQSSTPRVYSNSCPFGQWCHPTISSSVVSFSSCLQSFPTSGSFQKSQLFASGG